MNKAIKVSIVDNEGNVIIEKTQVSVECVIGCIQLLSDGSKMVVEIVDISNS